MCIPCDAGHQVRTAKCPHVAESATTTADPGSPPSERTHECYCHLHTGKHVQTNHAKIVLLVEQTRLSRIEHSAGSPLVYSTARTPHTSPTTTMHSRSQRLSLDLARE